MRLGKKIFIIVPAILIFLFSVGLLLQITILPVLIQGKILSALKKSGFTNANVKVRSVSYWGAVLKNLNIGLEKQFQLRKIKVRYSLRSIWHNEITSIHVYGAKINITIKDHVWDFEPLQSIMEKGGSDGLMPIPFNDLYLEESSLSLLIEGQLMTFPINGTFRKTGDNISSIELQSRINEASFLAHVTLDQNNKYTKGGFEITGLDLALLKTVAAIYPVLKGISGQGLLDLSGKFSYTNGQLADEKKGSLEIDIKGDHMQIQKQTGAQGFIIIPLSIQTKATFTIDSTGLNLFESSSAANIERFSSKTLGLEGKNIRLSLPYDWRDKRITNGTLKIGTTDFHVLSFSNVTAAFKFDNHKMEATANGLLGPWARVDAAGTFTMDKQGLTGDIVAKVPPFTTQNKKWLASIIPPIKEDQLQLQWVSLYEMDLKLNQISDFPDFRICGVF